MRIHDHIIGRVVYYIIIKGRFTSRANVTSILYCKHGVYVSMPGYMHPAVQMATDWLNLDILRRQLSPSSNKIITLSVTRAVHEPSRAEF